MQTAHAGSCEVAGVRFVGPVCTTAKCVVEIGGDPTTICTQQLQPRPGDDANRTLRVRAVPRCYRGRMPEQDLRRDVVAVSPEEAQREKDLRQVEATLLEIEAVARRADRVRIAIARAGRWPNLALALDDTIESLDSIRRTLQQQAHFGGDQARMF